ncbi:MAG TPA: type IV-A pilus assembly ATPase PilB, partial [Stenotrophomonas sp.]|nr:type IV-A pilus assembly ATPase PilB [Stenotrophomonas sp.]
MNAVVTANLVGITGIARRLVQDGALDEATARDAMAKASAAKQPLPQYFAEKKLVTAAQLAAANALEFGMPLLDVTVFDSAQNAISLVSEELLRKHHVLPLFKRGGKLFVGTSDPTHSLDEIKFHTNLVVEPILVDEEQIKRTLEQWQSRHDTLGSTLGGDDEGMGDLDVSAGDEEGGASDSGVDAKGDDTPVVKF